MEITRIDHIGIAVQSLESALKLYRDAFGMNVKGIEQLDDRHLKVAFIEVGESCIELLEPTSEASTIHKHLEKRGEGIHHIALHVEDIDSSILHLQQQGYRLLSEEAQRGAGNTRIVFLHPKDSLGVLIELVEGSH